MSTYKKFPILNYLAIRCKNWAQKLKKNAFIEKNFNSFSCKVCLLELIGQFLPPVTTSIHTKLEIWQK
jgi:hypothetical protein